MAPCRSTLLDKQSIKVIGPKVCITVPEEAKILPFTKSFAKHMKNLYISEFPTEIRTNEIVSKKQAEKLRKWNEFECDFSRK